MRNSTRKRVSILFVLVIGLMGLSRVEAGEQTMFSKLLPQKVNGWTAGKKDSFYDRKTLFHYMNGAAEVYLAYDFRRLLVREYLKDGEAPIVAEIYKMSSSRDAYGVFSHDTDGEEVQIAQGGIYGLGLLRFWKGRIFVRLLADRETGETKATLFSLARSISSSISLEGEKPKILSFLPPSGLLKETVAYFHKQLSLDLHYYLGDPNVLNLSERTEAVLARYRIGDQKVRLLICQYPDSREAAAAFKNFVKSYFSDKAERESSLRVEKIEKGEFTSARHVEKTVILVFEAGDRKTCESLTEAVEKKIREGS